MSSAPQIRQRLAEWLDGKVSLGQFEDWFVPATWDIHKANDAEAEDLADEIEMNLSEHSDGVLNERELREALARLVNHRPVPHLSWDVPRGVPVAEETGTAAGFVSASSSHLAESASRSLRLRAARA